jgi:Flp pilus assembly protein TadG
MRAPLAALSRLGRGLVAFRRDHRGVSAVEFALIAPVLILIYMGLAELSQAMTAQRRVSHAASAVGDLVAQTDKITNSDMNDIFAAAATIMIPFPTDRLSLRVTSVTGDKNGNGVVDWSSVPTTAQDDLPAAAAKDMVPTCTTATLPGVLCVPTGLITALGDNVVVAESSYTYEALVKYVLKDGLKFNEKFYMRPRKSSVVVRDTTS